MEYKFRQLWDSRRLKFSMNLRSRWVLTLLYFFYRNFCVCDFLKLKHIFRVSSIIVCHALESWNFGSRSLTGQLDVLHTQNFQILSFHKKNLRVRKKSWKYSRRAEISFICNVYWLPKIFFFKFSWKIVKNNQSE